ncbi:MAG TPA: Verru_Chthon cassette protein B [Chthoniobacteraceae bacterium]|nr:Verru_Chthon cassette protein B [Chthoniobacteraceae bacterium]
MTTTRTQSSAFSLVETALAIGIVAFAFVSLIALLPLGLTHFRSAVDTSVESQIFQRVVTDAEQADFDLLTGSAKSGSGQFYVLPARFFDEQGGEIVPRSPGQPTAYEAVQIIYHVHVRGSKPGPNAVDAKAPALFTSLPALQGKPRFTPRDSTFLTIQIAHNPGARALPLDENMLWDSQNERARALAIATFSAVITRNGFPRTATP